MHKFYYVATVFLVFGNGIGCRKVILADEQTRTTARQCDQLDQYQKEVKQLSNRYNSVRQNNIELERRLNSLETKKNSGVSYTRWGRTTCQNSASLVYKGHMGGNHYTSKGGGVNYLCLTHHPEYGNRVDGVQGLSTIYGTEYETAAGYEPIFSRANNGGQSLQDLDALCAVCYVPSRSTQIMIPAKRTCPAGWTMEYRGYLMTQHVAYNAKDFICVDEEPEGWLGSYANNGGAVFYTVEGICGSLPCPPYVNGWELTCVVCSR